MRKLILITGADECKRNRVITHKQNTSHHEIRCLLPQADKLMLQDVESSWPIDLYISVDDKSSISPDILEKVSEEIFLEEKDGRLFEVTNGTGGITRDEINDNGFPSWIPVINTCVIIIGNTDSGKSIIPPEVIHFDDCDSAFTFGILLSARELHNPAAHCPAEIAWRIDKLFPGHIGNILYDPKTRTGAASYRGTPPEVGMIRLLPE
ncbi:hypothetical protein [Neisseria dumasiana]|uniref:Uncharacterized protein n=2 Tax=Neisseria dumasiana TaxID=1931275 RepID=A0A1X3DJ87_9NEIS|nr:hypothetical protein [Neisseria dumasiana]OSI23514.1 hypothetical protein BV912_03670 [Neisseria dumasiana]UOO84349.1 hypothetical protein LVJ88_11975 [Neisseria dumasiana]